MQADKVFDELKDKSFKNAKTVDDIPKLAAFQKAMLQQTHHNLLADDVANWLAQQNEDTKQHVNNIIRHVMAVSS